MNLEIAKKSFETTNNTNRGRGSNKEAEIVFADESYQVMGACYEVYNYFGCGFLEGVYQEALAIELADRLIPFQELILRYKSHTLKTHYKPDFICFGKIILEIKAVSRFCDEYRTQVHNYLKATGYKLGLLVNFGQHPKVIYERIVR
jgi:GxxExxY protein